MEELLPTRFALSVREITSVSATFILSAEARVSDEPTLADFGWTEDGEESDEDSTPRIIPDTLSKGLSLLVNGQPWQRVLMRIDDRADEAIIIIYGLMPGRQYDIELGVAPGDENIRGQVTTELVGHPDIHLSEDDGASSPGEDEDESTLAGSGASSPTSHTPPQPQPLTIDERAAQLRQALAHLAEEHAALTNSLKSTRRESQRTDAGLRAEIEALKRATEKQTAGELRARQKTLALQEAAKQAAGARTDADAAATELERALPALQADVRAREAEHTHLRAEADTVRDARERACADARKRGDTARGELAALANRLDKLGARRERLEAGTLLELEEQLRSVQEEIAHVERDPYGYLLASTSTTTAGEEAVDGSAGGGAGVAEMDAIASVLELAPDVHGSHRRGAHARTTTIGRPGPIQRPQQQAHGSPSVPSSVRSNGPLVSVVPPLPLQQSISAQGAPRRIAQPPSQARAMGGKAGASMVPPTATPVAPARISPLNSNSSTTSLVSVAPGGSPALMASGSMLSGRAMPFEPRRPAAGRSSELNPASSPFEPKSILMNPNRQREKAGK